jgi:hypothetical protein
MMDRIDRALSIATNFTMMLPIVCTLQSDGIARDSFEYARSGSQAVKVHHVEALLHRMGSCIDSVGYVRTDQDPEVQLLEDGTVRMIAAPVLFCGSEKDFKLLVESYDQEACRIKSDLREQIRQIEGHIRKLEHLGEVIKSIPKEKWSIDNPEFMERLNDLSVAWSRGNVDYRNPGWIDVLVDQADLLFEVSQTIEPQLGALVGRINNSLTDGRYRTTKMKGDYDKLKLGWSVLAGNEPIPEGRQRVLDHYRGILRSYGQLGEME